MVGGAITIAQWICLCLPLCLPRFESKAHHLRINQICARFVVWKCRNIKKRLGLAHFKKSGSAIFSRIDFTALVPGNHDSALGQSTPYLQQSQRCSYIQYRLFSQPFSAISGLKFARLTSSNRFRGYLCILAWSYWENFNLKLVY